MTKIIDAVKRFELQTQQEIRNYKDSHNNVLKAIRELKERIDEIDHNTTENLASVISEVSVSEINLEKELIGIKSRLDSIEKNQRDFSHSISVVATEVSNINERALNLSTSCLKLVQTLEENQRKFNEFSNMVDDVVATQALEIARIDDHFKSRLCNLKNELVSAPAKEKDLYDNLNEKINCHIVDVEGINREMRIYKKENMITQKKIEQIYGLIEGLKKGAKSEPSFNNRH